MSRIVEHERPQHKHDWRGITLRSFNLIGTRIGGGCGSAPAVYSIGFWPDDSDGLINTEALLTLSDRLSADLDWDAQEQVVRDCTDLVFFVDRSTRRSDHAE